MDNLNSRQIDAITAPSGPVLVLAGAGSGKTTVLIRRVAHLIREHGLRPYSILAITFTKKAAEELRSRLSSRLGTGADDVWAHTFHAACAKILRRDIERLGYGRDFTIYDTDDGARVIKICLGDLNLDPKQFTPRTMLSYISRAKNAAVPPERYESVYGERRIADIYALYVKKLRANNALDFDDILLKTVELFEKAPDVLEYYQDKFKALLVDEYQDTNPIQYRLCALLTAKSRNIFVVGDDDQSIYRFRGATVENILSFEKEYPDAAVIRLEQNYRSTQNILTAANTLIENNLGRTGKSLWTDTGRGRPVALFRADNDYNEADYIAGRIEEHVRGGGSYNGCAVLYRMNAQSNRIEEALRRRSIPYRVIGGTRFFDRAEIRDMLAYLHILNNPSDSLRLARIINTPPRGIGGKALGDVISVSAELDVPLMDAVRSSAHPALARFYALYSDLRALLDGGVPLTVLYDCLLDKTGYLRALRDKNDFESEGRAENVMELKSTIAKFELDFPGGALSEFLENVSLETDVENYDAGANAVVLMTIHSAKGLEFPTVFVTGLEEGIFPSLRTLDPMELEEERRLCYVAMTRAKKTLYLTCAASRMLFGQPSTNPVSRFIGELPKDCVEKIEPTVKYVADTGTARNIKPRAAERPSVVSNAARNVTFAKGSVVEHKAFGRGTVTNVSPMGGDALLEVAFDTVGTKRLMRNTASQHMSLHDRP
ncbi:MAG: UvrD-helicase domain-containing protein [Oscillospiraceae bacterium]|nr:UvrD-helicase domain-containing protein [Oscillospiraceae bacterium]